MPIEKGDDFSGSENTAAELAARVAAAQSGDRDALEKLLHDHYANLYGVCHRLLGTDSDAADAAQDAMISVVKGLSGFDNRSSFSTWAYRIAYNCSIDLLRRRSRRPIVSIDDATDHGLEVPTVDSVDSVEARLDVSAALMKLPIEFRGPVALRDLCGLDYAEIGEVLRIPPGTVRSRIARGRAMLVDTVRAARSEI